VRAETHEHRDHPIVKVRRSKVRSSAHSKDLRTFEITDEGIVVGETLGRYEGLLTGSPDVIAGAASGRPERPRQRR
jgi:hypothetical protein